MPTVVNLSLVAQDRDVIYKVLAISCVRLRVWLYNRSVLIPAIMCHVFALSVHGNLLDGTSA